MICISTNCPRYKECGRAFPNFKEDGQMHSVEPLLYWGSGSYTYNAETKQVEVKNDYVCGPEGNWGMYIGE